MVFTKVWFSAAGVEVTVWSGFLPSCGFPLPCHKLIGWADNTEWLSAQGDQVNYGVW